MKIALRTKLASCQTFLLESKSSLHNKPFETRIIRRIYAWRRFSIFLFYERFFQP